MRNKKGARFEETKELSIIKIVMANKRIRSLNQTISNQNINLTPSDSRIKNTMAMSTKLNITETSISKTIDMKKMETIIEMTNTNRRTTPDIRTKVAEITIAETQEDISLIEGESIS